MLFCVVFLPRFPLEMRWLANLLLVVAVAVVVVVVVITVSAFQRDLFCWLAEISIWYDEFVVVIWIIHVWWVGFCECIYLLILENMRESAVRVTYHFEVLVVYGTWVLIGWQLCNFPKTVVFVLTNDFLCTDFLQARAIMCNFPKTVLFIYWKMILFV